jgi:Uma2 family endonuclease
MREKNNRRKLIMSALISLEKLLPAWLSPTYPAVAKKKLPTMYDLPSEDPEEPGLPDTFHHQQPMLLEETFRPPDYAVNQLFMGTDLNLYYDTQHESWYKRPDWFAVVGTTHYYKHSQDTRRSYVIWDEPVTPFIVVELLSPSTAAEDLGRTKAKENHPPPKWEVYERIAKIPYYAIFDGHTDKLQLFHLALQGYREVSLSDNRFWFKELKLGLGLWKGVYDETNRYWLRWYDAAGNWIPNKDEKTTYQTQLTEQERQRAEQADQRAEQADQRAEQADQRAEQERQRAEQERQRAEQAEQCAEQERQRAEQERQRAEQERQRAEQLAAKLRALGIDPEQL